MVDRCLIYAGCFQQERDGNKEELYRFEDKKKDKRIRKQGMR